jgi:hypothetical protein
MRSFTREVLGATRVREAPVTPVWWPVPPRPPSEANYTIPGTVTEVDTIGELETALAGGTAVDIYVRNGSYSRSGPITPAAAHRVWCESVTGVTFDFGFLWGARIGWEWHGGTINITSSVKIAANGDTNPKSGGLVTDTSGSNNTAMNMRISDVAININHLGKFCIYLGRPAGGRVQRCLLQGANYESLYAFNNVSSNLTNWLNSTVALDVVEDLDIRGIYDVPRGNQDGSDEYGLIIGHKVTNGVQRIRCRDIGWGGMATIGKVLDTTFKHMNMDGIYGRVPPVISNMAAPTLSQSSTGGSLSNGTYAYVVTAVTPQGETMGTLQSITLNGGTATQRVTISWPAATDEYVTAFRVYGRSGVSSALRLLPTQPVGLVTSVDDTGATIVSSTAPPLANTTGSPTAADDGYYTGQALYLEVTTRRCVFERIWGGPELQRGVAMEWDENKNYKLTAQYTIGNSSMSIQYGATSDTTLPTSGTVYIGEGENPPAITYTGKSVAGSIVTLTGCSGGSGGPYAIGTLISTWPGGRQACTDVLIHRSRMLTKTTRGESTSNARSRRGISMDDGSSRITVKDCLVHGAKTIAGAPSGVNGSALMDNTGVPHAGEGGTSELTYMRIDAAGRPSGVAKVEKPSS